MSHGKSKDFLALNPMLRQGLSCFQFSGAGRWGENKRKKDGTETFLGKQNRQAEKKSAQALPLLSFR